MSHCSNQGVFLGVFHCHPSSLFPPNSVRKTGIVIWCGPKNISGRGYFPVRGSVSICTQYKFWKKAFFLSRAKLGSRAIKARVIRKKLAMLLLNFVCMDFPPGFLTSSHQPKTSGVWLIGDSKF